MIYATGRYRNNQGGFTLIEVLLVVLILGTLLSIATLRLASSFSGTQLSAASRDIIALARYAGQRAVFDETYYRMNFDASKGNYWLTCQKQALIDEKFQHIPGTLGKIYSLPEKVAILKVSHPNDTFAHITFYPDGTMDETKVYLENDKGKINTLSSTSLVGKMTVEEISGK